MKFKKLFLSTVFVIAAQSTAAQMPEMLPQGKAEVRSMTSEVLGVEREYSIYLPKSYTVQKRQTFLGPENA
jgi:hypothetical protein